MHIRLPKIASVALLFCTVLGSLSVQAADTATGKTAKTNPQVVLHTTRGAITLELFADKSPLTVANFLEYVKSGHYNGTIFHRVIRNFMIQTGGMTADMVEKPTRDPVLNESKNRLHNERWTVAMARRNDPDSARAQFFINLKMNTNLDYQNGQPGYTVFGKVIDGEHIVKAISLVPTTAKDGHQDVPIEPIVIERVEIL